MSRVSSLLKNIGFLSLSSLGTKIISFLMIPIYTNVLTTEEYGQYDFFNTTVSLLIPFLTLNINESTMIFSLSKNNDISQVLSVSIKYIARSILFFIVFILINEYFAFSIEIKNYSGLITFMFITQAISGVIISFARGLDRLKEIAISSVLCSLVIVILNLITLLYFDMGLSGYFISNTLGPFVQTVYLYVAVRGWHYSIMNGADDKLEKEMLSFSKPLILNSTAWWINSISDRYIIIWFCGIAVNGVYSVAGKIPMILDVFRGIFIQAWTITAVKEFDPDDNDGFFANMYNLFNFCMTMVCSILVVISKVLAYFLYAKEFFEAWVYVPFLLMAILFGALAGYIGSIYAAAKDSKMYAKSTIIGAIVNLILNLFLIRIWGPLGAAVSTAISYWIIYWIRLNNVKKHMNLKLNVFRDNMTYLIIAIQCVLLIYITNHEMVYYLEVSCLFMIIVFHRSTLLMVRERMLKLFRGGFRCN